MALPPTAMPTMVAPVMTSGSVTISQPTYSVVAPTMQNTFAVPCAPPQHMVGSRPTIASEAMSHGASRLPVSAMPQPSVQPSLSLEMKPPGTLTQGLPDPRAVEQQREQYMRTLDEQLKQGAEVLNAQLKQQQECLLRMGDQEKRQFGLQVDQRIKQQELELVQQHNQQLLMLQQAAQQQKAALEQQANALLLEYNQKKAAEDLASQMFKFEAESQEAHKRYDQEMRALQNAQAVGAQQLAAQGEALARQASISNMQAISAQQVTIASAASLGVPLPGQTPRGGGYGGYTPTASYLPPVTTTPTASYMPAPIGSYGQPHTTFPTIFPPTMIGAPVMVAR